MSSKSYILERVKQNKPMLSVLPVVPMFERKDDVSLISLFKENLEFVGGRLIELNSKEELNGQISEIYPDLKIIASTLNVEAANLDLNSIIDPHALKGIDLTIIQGDFGVAENGAIWIPANTISHRVLPFITQHLVIILDKTQLVCNMHQAYQKLDIHKADGFGVFLSGPSKTADIEQSLVIGAHGSRSLVVFLV
ncbi:MAG: LUD domain-containing protein [Bacteroidales bacterium]|nr:LUD domain-containing protein [Bacteroidales bacterium]